MPSPSTPSSWTTGTTSPTSSWGPTAPERTRSTCSPRSARTAGPASPRATSAYTGEGKLETISKEVYGVIVLDESRTTYVITDIDRESNLELALLKDGELTSIIDEMSDNGCIFVDSTQILYTSDDDLYLWNGKESVRIARDVLRVWASAQESYSTYAP